MCIEFADKMLMFAVWKKWLLEQRETEASFVLMITETSCDKSQTYQGSATKYE